MAVVPLSVGVTTLARNDPGMVLVVVVTAGVALACYRRPRTSWSVAAGALAGVATAIKYSSFPVLVPVGIAVLASSDPMNVRIRRTAYALGGFVSAIAITNHFVWADVPRFLGQLSEQVAITDVGHWAATSNPAWVYAHVMRVLGPGDVWLLLAGAFAVFGLTQRRVDLWILLSFPLLYVWFMTSRPSQLTRWVLPALPFVAICGAAALVAACRWARAGALPGLWLGQPARRRVAIVLFAAGLAQPLWLGAVSFSRLVTPPTHTVVEAWLNEHAAPGSQVLLGDGFFAFQTPPFVIQRVPDLLAVLDDGVGKLAGCGLVVVPEGMLEHPALKELSLVERVYADQSFGGRAGLDYHIYRIPDLPPPHICAEGAAAE